MRIRLRRLSFLYGCSEALKTTRRKKGTALHDGFGSSVSILSLNSEQNVFYVYTDLSILTWVFLCCFFRSSVCPQTDTDQLHNTQQILRAFTHESKKVLSQVISSASFQKQVHSYGRFVLVHGSGARSLKSQIYEDATELQI